MIYESSTNRTEHRKGWIGEKINTHMFSRFIGRIFHFVKIVFVQLPYEACEIGVFEHFGKDSFGELIRVLSVMINKECAGDQHLGETYMDNERITVRPPAYDVLHGVILEDSVGDFMISECQVWNFFSRRR